jgi:hypothetical protein
MLHALLGGESFGLFNDVSSLLLTGSNKSPHYYMSPRLGSLPVIPLSVTTKANSTRAAQNRKEQYTTIVTYM